MAHSFSELNIIKNLGVDMKTAAYATMPKILNKPETSRMKYG